MTRDKENLDMAKQMDIKEFREKGYLQEVNRIFFHPLGLELGISQDPRTEEESLYAVWDLREDKAGVVFDIKNSSEDRKERFRKNRQFLIEEFSRRAKERKNLLGFIREPLY